MLILSWWGAHSNPARERMKLGFTCSNLFWKVMPKSRRRTGEDIKKKDKANTMVNSLTDLLGTTEVWSNQNLLRTHAPCVSEVSKHGKEEGKFFHQPSHSFWSMAAPWHIMPSHSQVILALIWISLPVNLNVVKEFPWEKTRYAQCSSEAGYYTNA